MNKSAFKFLSLYQTIGKTASKLQIDRVSKFIFKTRAIIPDRPTLTFLPSRNVTDQDVELCKRLIFAYQESRKNFSKEELSAIWSTLIQSKYGKLSEALNTANAELLARELSTMFQQPFTRGISFGDTWKSKIFGEQLVLSTFLEKLVSLAEYLGVVRTENPEQGIAGYALKDGVDELVTTIEKAIGISIGFPDVGAAYGVKVGNSVVTPESFEHIYVALRINQAINLHINPDIQKLNIVEIGAGFGGTASWLLKTRQRNIENYTIIDLPLMNVLQGYFLSQVFGVEQVALYGESSQEGDTQSHKKLINILPTYYINQISGRNIDVLINQNSMPEMTEQAVSDYITWAKSNIRGIFYSYNHEAYSLVNGIPQVLVPEIVERVGGFKRLSRNYSWMWKGYVEEVYAPEEN